MFDKQEILNLFNNIKNKFNKPVVIEVLGTPNSGKTTAVQTLDKIFKRSYVKYKVIYEMASNCKIENKLSPDFNIWTLCETLKCLLEALHDDYDLIICERGLLDTICWYQMFYELEKVDYSQLKNMINYIISLKIIEADYYTYIMTCDASTSIKREYLNELLDIKGTIVNEKIISMYNNSLHYVCESNYGKLFKNILTLDTSSLSQKDINSNLIESIIKYFV